jgi:hypothetical protein
MSWIKAEHRVPNNSREVIVRIKTRIALQTTATYKSIGFYDKYKGWCYAHICKLGKDKVEEWQEIPK